MIRRLVISFTISKDDPCLAHNSFSYKDLTGTMEQTGLAGKRCFGGFCWLITYELLLSLS